MEITIIKEREQTKEKISFSGQTVLQLLKQLKINLETVLVTRNDEVLTEDELLNDNDILEILNVVSGG